MFSKFFYTLKDKGLDVSLGEWLDLQEALDKGLCESSLTQFYYVARMILVKSETEFDKFDMAFEECFKGVKTETEVGKICSAGSTSPICSSSPTRRRGVT